MIATGVQYSVRQFATAVAEELGLGMRWEGDGLEEKGYDADGRCVVQVDPRYFRPAEVNSLIGDPAKAREKLGWQPTTSFADLVSEMVASDLAIARRDELVLRHGYEADRDDV